MADQPDHRVHPGGGFFRGDGRAGPSSPVTTRRGFLRRAGRAAAGVATGGLLAACSDGLPLSSGRSGGGVEGTVVTASGEPANIGEVYLMRSDGLTLDWSDEVGRDGTWGISGVPAGEWQVRYWGSGRAHVLHERTHNPQRVRVREGETVDVRFAVELAPHHGEHMVQIYVGEDFFQEQPLGEPNGTVEVPRGYDVCWYNVTEQVHEVVGEPWGTSGKMEHLDAFIWEADRVGEFDYQCPYHSTKQKAKLVVEEAEHLHG